MRNEPGIFELHDGQLNCYKFSIYHKHGVLMVKLRLFDDFETFGLTIPIPDDLFWVKEIYNGRNCIHSINDHNTLKFDYDDKNNDLLISNYVGHLGEIQTIYRIKRDNIDEFLGIIVANSIYVNHSFMEYKDFISLKFIYGKNICVKFSYLRDGMKLCTILFDKEKLDWMVDVAHNSKTDCDCVKYKNGNNKIIIKKDVLKSFVCLVKQINDILIKT
jgi:hypothetical protein